MMVQPTQCAESRGKSDIPSTKDVSNVERKKTLFVHFGRWSGRKDWRTF